MQSEKQGRRKKGKKKKGYLGVVILPNPASDLMTSQIEGFEFDFANAELLRGWILGGLMLD